MTSEHHEPLSAAPEEISVQQSADLPDRLLDHVGRAASVQSVFGAPVTAHGRTVIPVARTYFALGGGGGQSEGKAGVPDPSIRSTGAGGGGGGAGCTFASGYIELSPEGTRYIAISNNRDRLIGVAAGLMLGLVLVRFLRR